METKKQQAEAIVRRDCPTRRGLALLADQWTMLVIAALSEDKKRFSQLHAQIEGISKKMLTQTLRALERNGLVKRVIYPVIPPRVEYSLTPLGQTVLEPLLALRDWSEHYIEEIERRRATYDQQARTSLQEDIMALVQQRADVW
jgi:DNA-binding HxlR family transcriptional regulator